jgi:cobalamin biosynthesis protein CobT
LGLCGHDWGDGLTSQSASGIGQAAADRGRIRLASAGEVSQLWINFILLAVIRRVKTLTTAILDDACFSAATDMLGCSRSASEEMQNEHYDADYQQDVDQSVGHMERQEPKQPKHNQNRSDYSKHVFISLR